MERPDRAPLHRLPRAGQLALRAATSPVIELIVAVGIAAFAGARNGWAWDGPEPWAAIAILWPGLYLLSCALLPYGRCPSPWCPKRRPTHGDGRGHYRRRRACRVCGSKDYQRLGARLIGRG
ncbi:MAG: hypothetical protein AB7I38_18835 [Dehalococcoidia bacterium]